MPLKQPEKSPLPSQILGLSDFSRAPHEVALSGCHRKWIKETDSAYVRLAKQGGRPDLLRHYTPVVMKSPPPAYAVPDWYSHSANPARAEKTQGCVSSLPDYMVHREFIADDHHSKSYETRRGPFEFDTESVWQREAEDKEHAEKKKVKLPPITPKYPSRMPTVSTNKEFSGENKLSFPPVPAKRESEAVNFSKLISNGYGTDWLQQNTGWEKKIEETSENSEHSEDSERSESPPASNELKPPFQGSAEAVSALFSHRRCSALMPMRAGSRCVRTDTHKGRHRHRPDSAILGRHLPLYYLYLHLYLHPYLSPR
ncbi:uncharacterized protein C7orf57 homolog [Onychostruthus taczanowskii]|uniref:uncharacterized protein C7orf57 homolog n=1 Tax=Onychostruthus taczanowskii TaxID=356909 RepID=UPI001B80292B|nr:uncharacterized protein C7orf57 homolog [Onychostruthus taczanowskii]